MAEVDTEAPWRRGMVLLALHSQYPLALRTAALEGRLAGVYDDAMRGLPRDLAYLADSAVGAIRRETQTAAGRTYEVITLTAHGVDIVEGVATHAGIQIDRG